MWNVLCFLAELYCFTTDIVLLLRVVVAVCCIGIVASMFACLLDLCGTLNRCLKLVKDYSFGNVITGKLVFVNITFKNAVYIDRWVVLPFLWLLADWWATFDQNQSHSAELSWQLADSFGREMFFITFTNLLFHYSAVKFWQKLGLKSYATFDCKTVCIFAYSSMRKCSNKSSGVRLKTENETGGRC